MNANDFLVGTIIVSIIWIIILYIVVKAAINSSRQIELLQKQNGFTEIQLRLLAELLKKQGVSDDALYEIIDLKKVYFSKHIDKKS